MKGRVFFNLLNGNVYESTPGRRLLPGLTKDERASGRSTAQAFTIIGCALASPGVEMPMVDHAGCRGGDEYLCNKVKSLIASNNLKGFKVMASGSDPYRPGKSINVLVFNPLVPIEDLLDAYNKA